MGQKFIGMDLGTTFLKGTVIDLDSVTLGATVRVPFPGFIAGQPVSHREVEAKAIVDAVRELIKRLLPECGDCLGIVLCTQMHGLVLCDAQGNAYANAITWQDQRLLDPVVSGGGESTYERMMAVVSEQDRLNLGNDLLPGRPLGMLYWLQQQGVHLDTPQSLYACSLPDYVLSNLCKVEPCTDVTNAAAHGALNLRTSDWHHDLIGRLHLPLMNWPHIVPHGTVVGHLDIEGQHIPCFVPVGDHQCALLGTLLRDDELSINASTGSQVGILTSWPDVSLNFQTRPYFDGRYLKAVIHIPAGRALSALVRLLTELAEAQGVSIPDPWEYIERVTRNYQTTDLRASLAFYASSCGNCGAIENIREENLTIADLFTAAFENMAENYAVCVQRITSEPSWHRTVFTGGLFQKMSGLRYATLKKFPQPHRFAPTSEDTLLGLAIMALVCSGRARSITEATDITSAALK
jgi:sugar (pentulose or hexulose) kinase